jgi:hypothetical protein
LANFLGFSGKYGIAIAFTKYKEDNIILKNETVNNFTQNNLYYFNNNATDIPDIVDEDTITSYNINLYQNIFLYIHLVYLGCIFISIVFYVLLKCCYFQKKSKEKIEIKKIENKYGCCNCACCNCCLCCDCCEFGCCTCECCKCNICLWNMIFEMTGCIIYSERVDLLEEEEKKKLLNVVANYVAIQLVIILIMQYVTCAIVERILMLIHVVVVNMKKLNLIKIDNVFVTVIKKILYVIGLINIL